MYVASITWNNTGASLIPAASCHTSVLQTSMIWLLCCPCAACTKKRDSPQRYENARRYIRIIGGQSNSRRHPPGGLPHAHLYLPVDPHKHVECLLEGWLTGGGRTPLHYRSMRRVRAATACVCASFSCVRIFFGSGKQPASSRLLVCTHPPDVAARHGAARRGKARISCSSGI